uniref:RING-type E3 ubiquitin transferase n=1 Tax=Toxoplasma gondii COUG TaxID=1074873 RepID=A0A2G8Y5H7_TOXGO|nr:zinc finger, C3HC4 type (RING finger) domain-containing protein [Toxoplasma gondii COUG]
MAGIHVRYRTYALLSLLSVVTLVLRTWYVHEELYTVVAVLSTGKIALALFYNCAFMLFLGLGKLAMRLMVGSLRDLEMEQVIDSGRGFLLDTVLFLVLSSPTLDGAEVSTHALAKFLLIVVSLKTAHLVVQIRGGTLFEVGNPRTSVLLRICIALFSLLLLDICAVHFFFVNSSKASTFYLWLLFECLGMLVSCAISTLKFAVHVVDVRLDNGWAAKSAVIFYLELIHDVTSLVIFLLFMSVFFITQPSRLPLYMTADIIHVVKTLYKRILSFKRYRALTKNLEIRFPDATAEELETADTCIICRDLLFEGSKKLPCSHIFHIDCLRSWLVQQQSCPTCRADIPSDDSPSTTAPATATEAPPQHPRSGVPDQNVEMDRGDSRTVSASSPVSSDRPTSTDPVPQSDAEGHDKTDRSVGFAEIPDGHPERSGGGLLGDARLRGIDNHWTNVSANTLATQALLQSLQLACQTCDFYRLHASLWTIEAQRAQLAASRLQALRYCQAPQRSGSLDADTQRVSGQQGPGSNDASAPAPTAENEAGAMGQSASQGPAINRGRNFIVVCPSHLFHHQGSGMLPPPMYFPSLMPSFDAAQMPSGFAEVPSSSSHATPKLGPSDCVNGEWPGQASAGSAFDFAHGGEGFFCHSVPRLQPSPLQTRPYSSDYVGSSSLSGLAAVAPAANAPLPSQTRISPCVGENRTPDSGPGNGQEERTI